MPRGAQPALDAGKAAMPLSSATARHSLGPGPQNQGAPAGQVHRGRAGQRHADPYRQGNVLHSISPWQKGTFANCQSNRLGHMAFKRASSASLPLRSVSCLSGWSFGSQTMARINGQISRARPLHTAWCCDVRAKSLPENKRSTLWPGTCGRCTLAGHMR